MGSSAAVTPRPTADVLDELGDGVEVCTLAFERFGGVAMFAGRINTVRCLEDNVLVETCLGRPGRGRVLVVDGAGSLRRALVGDRVATLARDNGWAGLIVHGAVRDAAVLRNLDLAVLALGTHPRPSAKAGGGDVDEPVRFGDVTFRPGDVVYCDDDGIVVVPG